MLRKQGKETVNQVDLSPFSAQILDAYNLIEAGESINVSDILSVYKFYDGMTQYSFIKLVKNLERLIKDARNR